MTSKPAPVTDAERDFLAVVQEDLPLEPRPFAGFAAALGLDEAELLATLRRLIDRRFVRRYGAALHHREAGFSHNAMVTFDVPPEEVDAAGARAAAFPFVTHCYRRTRHPEWPYNLYAMVHSRSAAESEARVADVRRAVGEAYPSLALHSTKEYKKTSLRLSRVE